MGRRNPLHGGSYPQEQAIRDALAVERQARRQAARAKQREQRGRKVHVWGFGDDGAER